MLAPRPARVFLLLMICLTRRMLAPQNCSLIIIHHTNCHSQVTDKSTIAERHSSETHHDDNLGATSRGPQLGWQIYVQTCSYFSGLNLYRVTLLVGENLLLT